MLKYFKNKQTKKKTVLQQVKKDKATHKERKLEIKTLPDTERKAAMIEDKKLQKELKQQRKVELKSLNRKDRRAAKKEDKMYRKIKNRPRRFTIWSIVGLGAIFLIVQFGPTVTNLAGMISGKDITVVTNSPEAIDAREKGEMLSEEIANEGIILLENKDNHLPLENKKVNVFGVSALDLRYGGGGSGSSDTSRAVNLFDGLENAGISYNQELLSKYEDIGEDLGIKNDENVGLIQVVKGMLGGNVIDEPDISHLSDEIITQAKDYSENALIVISSSATEASDMTFEQLRLTENKRQLIDKVSENFENVTIIINAGNAMELGFVEEYDSIKSVLWIGTPGPYGANALGHIIAGNINPSGRTTDTYVYDNSSAPGSENFGDYKYDNLNYAFINYQESIYVGYRFYETYYLDDEEGYQNAVQYPFGHGLSYTDFEWTVLEQNFSDEVIELQIEVSNVGDIAGKDVVQAYYSPPYIEGSIEKSAIELGAYAKSSLLEPGQSEILNLSFQVADMASYDMHEEEAYVLDPGTYIIKVARNVHDIVESYDYELADKVVFNEDKDTGTIYENHFDLAKGDITYLSRNDWKNTYPTDDGISYEAPQYVLDAFKEEVEKSNNDSPTVEFDTNHGIFLEDLKGLDYDDPLWDDFLDQFTLEEMIAFVSNGAYKTIEIERLGIPQTLLMDGPAGFSYFFTKVEAAAYPTQVVLAAAWNDDLAYRMGESVGIEAQAYGIQGWYAPGMNIHRTALGGRNFEYFSEDPLLSGKIAANMTKGAQDQGIIVFMKHFALNDQETNARSGVLVWADEQAIREIYLKPFEITVKEGEVHGAMSSFSIIGTKWAGANSNLLNDILRKEWGFEGVVSSDAVFGFMKAPDAIVAGNDLMLDIMTPNSQEKLLKKTYKENPEVIANSLRTSVHNALYAILKTYLFE